MEIKGNVPSGEPMGPPEPLRGILPAGGRLVSLDPDIARVFTTAESVNSVLRPLITTMPTTVPR